MSKALWSKLSLISQAFKLASKTPVFQKDKRIVPAFILDGVQYYQFDDAFGMSAQRAFAAIDIFQEVQSRASRDYLIAHNEAMKTLLNSRPIDLTKIANLVNTLDERLTMVFDADLMYKLASVVYFDSSEDPYLYDYKYGVEKIGRFRAAQEKGLIDNFFLNTPIRQYLPFSDISKDDLEVYTKVGREVTKSHLKFLSDILSKKGLNNALSKELELRNTSI